MSGSSTSYLAFVLLGTIWLIGLWKSVQHAFPESAEQSNDLEISRKVLFHLAALFAAGAPVYTVLIGFDIFALRIWTSSFFGLYLLWAYWYLKAYRYSDFLFEASEGGGFSAARQMTGAPGFMALPHWIFNNPVLFFVGLALTLAGLLLSATLWQISYLSFTAYGIIYLFFVWIYNRLDIVKVWITHLEIRNGFSSGKATLIPLADIQSVSSSNSARQKRLRVSTVEIDTEQTSFKFAMKDAHKLVAALAPK